MAPDTQLSPGLLKKVVHAGVNSASFRQAAEDLQTLAEVAVSVPRVRRATEQIGRERVAASAAAAAAFVELPLPAQRESPGAPPPEVDQRLGRVSRVQLLAPAGSGRL